MSGPGGRPSGCGLCGVKRTGQYQSPEESPSASSIAGGLKHPCRAWQSSWQLCQSRLQFPVNASTKGGGPGLRPQNLRWQRFLAGRKRRCRAGMKHDIPGAGRRARAARRLPGSLPACFRHRGPTVGPRPQAVPHDCCKNCCDPSVSGPGCRPSGRGHMSPSPAVGKMHVSGAGRRPSRRAGAGVAKVIFMVQHRIWMARCPAEMKGCSDEMNSSGIRMKRSFAGAK
jgi:hypothetical protein